MGNLFKAVYTALRAKAPSLRELLREKPAD